MGSQRYERFMMRTTVYAAAGLAGEKGIPAMLEKVRAHLGVGKVATDLVACGRWPLVGAGPSIWEPSRWGRLRGHRLRAPAPSRTSGAAEEGWSFGAKGAPPVRFVDNVSLLSEVCAHER